MGINSNFRKNRYDEERRKDMQYKKNIKKQEQCNHENVGWFPDVYFCRDCGKSLH